MSKPPFVMSMYMNKETLYKEKAEYYSDRCEYLESVIIKLNMELNSDEKLTWLSLKLIEEAVEFIEGDK